MSYVKFAAMAVGIVVVGAAAVVTYKSYSEEMADSKKKTCSAKETADDIIRQAEEETERVRQECARNMAETDRKRAADAAAHERAMAALLKDREELDRKIAIRNKALTDWENQRISTAKLTEILMSTTIT